MLNFIVLTFKNLTFQMANKSEFNPSGYYRQEKYVQL